MTGFDKNTTKLNLQAAEYTNDIFAGQEPALQEPLRTESRPYAAAPEGSATCSMPKLYHSQAEAATCNPGATAHSADDITDQADNHSDTAQAGAAPTISDSFPLLEQFLAYMGAIKGRSPLTIREYHYDLRLFFRRYLQTQNSALRNKELNAIDLSGVDAQLLQNIKLSDFYRYITWLVNERQASPANRARKCSSIKSFFKYLCTKLAVLPVDPAADLELPKQLKRLPKYLNLEQTHALLRQSLIGNNNNKYSEGSDKAKNIRNYCILVLFLNCGMRLSELQALNLDDICEDTLRVIGKGNKERTIYLNAACIDALKHYLQVRPDAKAKSKDKHALFISREGNRLSKSMIQVMIKQALAAAGLGRYKFSTHKLRHTAATLMYQYGHVDIKALQEILGHESVATTEIYTHTNQDILHAAVESNPLAQHKLDLQVPAEKETADKTRKRNKKAKHDNK